MFLFDPVAGNRRRSLIRDQFVHIAHKTEDVTSSKMRHMRNVAKGMTHKMKKQFTPEDS